MKYHEGSFFNTFKKSTGLFISFLYFQNKIIIIDVIFVPSAGIKFTKKIPHR